MKSTKRVELDWSKLFGFNQVQPARGELKSKFAKATLSAKIGGKPGLKPT